MFITLWDVKEPTHYSKRVGREAPGVVAVLCAVPSLQPGGWLGVCLKRVRVYEATKAKKKNSLYSIDVCRVLETLKAKRKVKS